MKVFLITICLTITSLITYAQTLPEDPGRALHKDIEKITDADDFEIRKSKQLPADEQGVYFKVISNSTLHLYGYMGRQNTCRSGGCDKAGSSDNYDYFDYFILFSDEGEVLKVNVYNYQSSHGYQITSRYWLRQFNSYKGKQPLKTGRDVDAISGATISANALTKAVSSKTLKLIKYLKNNFEAE